MGDKLPIVSMTEPMDDFVAAHPEVKIGYVHGEEPVEDAVKTGKATGLLLPKLDKSRFLETVHAIGTLPRKAFSMARPTRSASTLRRATSCHEGIQGIALSESIFPR